MPGKCDPLRVLLLGAAERGQAVVELTFDGIEVLVGPLPGRRGARDGARGASSSAVLTS